MAEKFKEALSVFNEKTRGILMNIPDKIQKETYEIRVRKHKPLVLSGKYGTAFVDANSVVSYMRFSDGITINEREFNEIIAAVCGYSVYSHQHDMINGFVTYGSGNRVGFCGTAVTESEETLTVNNLSSFNIRIARDSDVSARKILNKLYDNYCPKGLIIAGPPCAGKTTVLKGIARILSSEYKFGFKKCAVIDERYEMNDINGVNYDLLCGYEKEKAVIHAIRTLSPEIIICDEISTVREADKIISGFYSGVSFVVSVHAGSRKELLERKVSARLIDSGFFENIVMLGDSSDPGKITEIIDTEELNNEANGNCIGFCKYADDNLQLCSK